MPTLREWFEIAREAIAGAVLFASVAALAVVATILIHG